MAIILAETVGERVMHHDSHHHLYKMSLRKLPLQWGDELGEAGGKILCFEADFIETRLAKAPAGCGEPSRREAPSGAIRQSGEA